MIPDLLAAGVVICVAFNLIKPFIDAALPPTALLHDAVMRLVVLAIGVTATVIQMALGAAPVTMHACAMAALQGAENGLAALLTYHLVPGAPFLPGDVLDAIKPHTPPPPPPPSTPPVIALP